MSQDPWKHRHLNMKCITWMWFVAKEGRAVGPRVGRCRRHVPSMNGYPVVFVTDWCGDHKIDENRWPPEGDEPGKMQFVKGTP